MNKKILLLCLFFTVTVICQNKRDHFIHDTIVNLNANLANNYNEDNFNKLLNSIEKLEKNYNTYEPEFRYHLLLQNAYKLNKIDFFKNQLSILVEKYGFDVAYMSENESYYNAIMKGDLSFWFKEMYLEKHFIWLKNNFEKQIDLRKLNSLHEKDQLINTYSLSLDVRAKHDSIQHKKDRELISIYSMRNAGELYTITQKYNAIPTGKTFALVQNQYAIIESHNLQLEDNYDRYYMLFFEYYKKAYLGNEITYTIFSNFDFNSYVHKKKQKFGLITKQNVLESYLTDKDKICPDVIPIEDLEFSKKIKKEFKWY
ncbi:hypothetical protein [Flavobacterium sp.]|uniref:hypothetical protein n=1 Tax=Flavobacterium sp. TaxID=239 RepID=UPI00374D77CB